MKKVSLYLILIASFAFSAEVNFFVQLPLNRNWLTGTPVLIENDDGVIHQMYDAGGNGWFRYSWEKEEIPESVYIYSAKDLLFQHPLGLDYGEESAGPLPMSLIYHDFAGDSIYYIPDEQCRLNVIDPFSATKKVFEESFCNDSYADYDVSASFYMLVPDYKDWIDDIPVIVDSLNNDNRWEMKPDPDGYAGWFYYKWNDEDWTPTHILIYKKSDSLLKNPIGMGGYAFGETELHSIPCCSGGAFFVPDWRYKCGGEITGTGSRFIFEDQRSGCLLRYESQKDGFEPYCYPNTLYYSVYTEDGILVIPERYSADSTEIVYLKNLVVHMNSSTTLEDGTFILKFWYCNDESQFKAQKKILVENGSMSIFAALNENYAQMVVWTSKGKLFIANGLDDASYAVFNPVGQVVAHGRIQGLVEIPLLAPGTYLVKVGSVIRRVKVR